MAPDLKASLYVALQKWATDTCEHPERAPRHGDRDVLERMLEVADTVYTREGENGRVIASPHVNYWPIYSSPALSRASCVSPSNHEQP